MIADRSANNSIYILLETRLDVRPPRYDHRKKLLIKNLDRIVLSNKKNVGFLSRVESLLGVIMSQIKYLEHFYNFTTDKDKLELR